MYVYVLVKHRERVNMTCIVGFVENDGTVWMGADRAGAAGAYSRSRKDVKLFKNNGTLIGCTSSFRMIQLLQYELVIPEWRAEKDLHKWMVKKFIPKVRACFKKHGFLQKEKEVESGGTFLVGVNGRLFSVQSDFQVAENDYYDSCGCGYAYALGALYGMDGQECDTDERITNALNAACEFSGWVKPPFDIMSIKNTRVKKKQ